VVANSFTAHRLMHLAADHGKQDAAKERLLSDHFEHGKDIGSREYLTALGLDLGIGAAELDELFTTDKYADDVRQDFEEGRALGISGVPFFVIDRKYGLSGAQPPAMFSQALAQAWQERQQLVMAGTAAPGTDGGESCGPEGCAV
jgi:predicted DsbA family dithiol-disulfide isomerase